MCVDGDDEKEEMVIEISFVLCAANSSGATEPRSQGALVAGRVQERSLVNEEQWKYELIVGSRDVEAYMQHCVVQQPKMRK